MPVFFFFVFFFSYFLFTPHLFILFDLIFPLDCHYFCPNFFLRFQSLGKAIFYFFFNSVFFNQFSPFHFFTVCLPYRVQ